MIFSAVLTTLCSDFLSEALEQMEISQEVQTLLCPFDQ